VLFVIADTGVLGALAVEDEIRPESREAVEKLHRLGMRVAMITGDSKAVAESVARASASMMSRQKFFRPTKRPPSSVFKQEASASPWSTTAWTMPRHSPLLTSASQSAPGPKWPWNRPASYLCAATLSMSWAPLNCRGELEAIAGGTRLTLWTSINRRFIAMGAAGWHICFDVLDRLLAGQPIGRIAGGEAMKFDGWQRLVAEYWKQFGVETPHWPPEAAQKS
jgi:hypothetical protein